MNSLDVAQHVKMLLLEDLGDHQTGGHRRAVADGDGVGRNQGKVRHGGVLE
jgi:hypothetical protein